jgi:hypothetical protein
MMENSFYQGKQGECFRLLEQNFEKIRQEYINKQDKIFLDPEDFSDGVRGLADDFSDTDRPGDYVKGDWRALGISSGEHEGQAYENFPTLYDILRKFPYKTNVAFMVVGPNTSIGTHQDDEGGWRFQMCFDDGGGDDSGMYYQDLITKEKRLHTFKTGNQFAFKPGEQPHNGFNRNPGERLTLLIDFYKESEYTPEAYESYLKNYDEKFEGLKELAELYEQRKQKA